MPTNPIERDLDILEPALRQDLETIAKATGEVAPVGKRLLTRNEKYIRGLATPASQWTPKQAEFMLRYTMGNKRVKQLPQPPKRREPIA